MPIKHWPATERPRERLLAEGAQTLTDAELLAIFVRSGARGRSAVDVARALLAQFGGLQPLAHAPAATLQGARGIGPARAAQVLAALELARRALRETLARDPVLGSPQQVREFLQLSIGGLPHEVFVALFLDAQHRLLAHRELFRGTLTQTSVYPREVVKQALAHNAAAVILAHNHPSGVAEPSRADELLTQALRQALALVDVRVLDHLVVTGGGAVSFAERGLL